MRAIFFTLLSLCLSFCAVVSVAAEVNLTKNFDQQALRTSDGKAQIQFRFGTSGKPLFKPYIDILTTLDGRNVLRDSPHDHLHHHAFMFAIKIDDVNFWEERPENRSGREMIRSYTPTPLTDPKAAGWTCLLDWQNPAGEKLAEENRKIIWATGVIPDAVLVDWTSVFAPASGKDSVKLGGNHYHGLGIRFDETMDKGGRFFSDSEKNVKEHVRGAEDLTVCNWMAYTAKLHDKPVTAAMFDCPQNVRKMQAFTMGDGKKVFAYLSATVNLHREPVQATKEKPVTFRYGVCLWEGERTAEEVEKAYQHWLKFAAGK